MSFRAAAFDKAAGIAAFLSRAPDRSMFPLSNLIHHGMGQRGRYQLRFWLKGQGIDAALDLSDLILPDDPALRLRLPEARDLPLLIGWRAAYRGEVMGTPPARREAAWGDIESYIPRGRHRAVLYAANDAAARACRATGFQPSGRMAMILYRPGTRVA